MKNNQKGFVIPLLVVVIALLVVGGGAYVYFQNKKAEIPAIEKTILPNEVDKQIKVSQNDTPFLISSFKASIPQKMSSGSPVAFLSSTNELIVSDFDKKLSKDGCEGFPEFVLMKISKKDLSRHPLFDVSGKPLNGNRIIKGPHGKVAIIDGCEGFLSSVFVGEDSGGDLINLKEIPLDQAGTGLQIISWGTSPNQLIAQGSGYNELPFSIFSLDVSTGSATKIFEPSGNFLGTMYIGQDMYYVEYLEKNESKKLLIRKYDGEVVKEVAIPKFIYFVIGPKNNIFALKDNSLYILGAENNFNPILFLTLPANKTVYSWDVSWESSGRYFAFVASDTKTKLGSLILADIQGNQIIIDSDSVYHSNPVFSDDGIRLAWQKSFNDPIKKAYESHAYVVDLLE